MKYLTSFLMAAFLLSHPLFGQGSGAADPLLDSLITVSLERHPDIEAMNRMVEASEARRKMSGSLMNPSLSFGIMDVPSNFRLNEDPATAFTIGVMQRFPWAGKRKASSESATARTEAARIEIEIARQQMALMIAKMGYELAALTEEYQLLNDGLRLSGEMTAAARWMAGSAMGRQADIERARLEEEDWKLKIIAKRGEIERARADLAYALGIEPDTLLFSHLTLPEGLPSLPNLDSLFATGAVDDAPEMRLAKAKVEASSRDLQRARLNWYPDFDVMVGVGIKPDLKSMGDVDHNGQPLPSGTIDQMNMYSAEVTFPLPLFAKGNQRSEIAEMTAMRSTAAADLSDTKLSLERDLRRIHASWKEQNDCCAFVQESLIGRAESLYHATLTDYQSGRTPFMELSQAKMSLVMARMELSMSRAIAWSDRAELLAKIGDLAPTESELK